MRLRFGITDRRRRSFRSPWSLVKQHPLKSSTFRKLLDALSDAGHEPDTMELYLIYLVRDDEAGRKLVRAPREETNPTNPNQKWGGTGVGPQRAVALQVGYSVVDLPLIQQHSASHSILTFTLAYEI